MAMGTNENEIIRKAEELHSQERYLAAAAKLRSVPERPLTAKHLHILQIADNATAIQQELMQDQPKGWTKQMEKHGLYDVVIYYKVDKKTNQIQIRIDSVIESSLVNPLISVFNESDLISTWMPHYKFPIRLGISESKKLAELGRGHQVIDCKIDMPPMFSSRECISHVAAIDSVQEHNSIIVVIDSLDTGKHFDIDIPPVEKGYTRIDFRAGILFRPCPANHPVLRKSKHLYPPNEKLVLVSFTEEIDAHVRGVPQKLINFFTRTFVAAKWTSLLKVTQEIRDGKLAEHMAAIQQKQELYSWVSQRVQDMFKE